MLAAGNMYNSQISPWNVIFVLAGFTWLAQGLQYIAMRKLVNVKVSPGSASCARCLLKGSIYNIALRTQITELSKELRTLKTSLTPALARQTSADPGPKKELWSKAVQQTSKKPRGPRSKTLQATRNDGGSSPSSHQKEEITKHGKVEVKMISRGQYS